MGKLKPYHDFFGQQFTVIRRDHILEPALLGERSNRLRIKLQIWNPEKEQRRFLVEIEPVLVKNSISPVPIITRSHSARRCPRCNLPQCLQSESLDAILNCLCEGRYYTFLVCQCIKQGKFFLKEISRLKVHKNRFACCHCGSEDVDIVEMYEAYATKQWKEARLRMPKGIPKYKRFILATYDCVQCASRYAATMYENEYKESMVEATTLPEFAIIARDKKYHGIYQIKKIEKK